MDRTTVVLLTLVLYKAVLLAIGLYAERLTRSEADFFLGGRQLGPFVAAISASASSSSVWTLLGVSGFAYAEGLQAVWLFPSCVGGFALNWYVIAPRLRRAAAEHDALTVTDLCIGRWRGPGFGPVRAVASMILVFCLTAYVASQFVGAGKSFESNFEMSGSVAILIGSAIVVVYTLLGGFWAVSLTDTVQGLLMAAVAIMLPGAALIAVGGPGELLHGLTTIDQPGYLSFAPAPEPGTAALAVVALLGIGLGYPGQPHVVNRFMALRDETALRQGRRIAMAWAVVVYAGMITLGWCGRVLHAGAPVEGETAFFALSNELFSPVLAGLVLAAVLSAIMSTADSQLLVAASAVSHDLGVRGRNERRTLLISRLVVLAVSGLAVLLALSVDETIFRGVLFAWSALAGAFGPLLIVTLWRGPVPATPALIAIVAGFGLAVTAYQIPALAGGVVERVAPIALGLAILWWTPRPSTPAPSRPTGPTIAH